MIFLMHDKFLYVFMRKKRRFHQIKYFKCAKSEIKLKKVTTVFVSFYTFAASSKRVSHQIHKINIHKG